MTAKKREFPGFTVVPDVLRLFSMEGLTPISSATDASCASVSCKSLSGSTTEASIWSPNFFGGASFAGSGADGGVSDVGVLVPEVSDDDEDGVDVPMSWSRLYSMPLTLANSRSSTMDMSRLDGGLDVGVPGRSTPRSASRE